MRFAHLVIIAALSAPQIWAQDIIAFTGAKIIPMAGPEIASGVLKVEDARIVAVGPASSTQIPAGARRIDASGKSLCPD